MATARARSRFRFMIRRRGMFSIWVRIRAWIRDRFRVRLG